MSTEIAAQIVPGTTLHSMFKLADQKDGPMVRLVNHQVLFDGSDYLRVMRGQWEDTAFLFIKEISIVTYEMVCMVDSGLKQLKNNDELFGGTNLLLVGDLMVTFHQSIYILNPIIGIDPGVCLP